ncbi:hypothetical protein [Streptomyces sp. NPDC127197]|uniref:hypothetical protein n=1 Tax=Streptomyces sp. NPDC127197 TaxID=3345388 RepID=UPI00363C49EF
MSVIRTPFLAAACSASRAACRSSQHAAERPYSANGGQRGRRRPPSPGGWREPCGRCPPIHPKQEHKATHYFGLVNWWLDDVSETVFAIGGLRFYGDTGAGRLPSGRPSLGCDAAAHNLHSEHAPVRPAVDPSATPEAAGPGAGEGGAVRANGTRLVVQRHWEEAQEGEGGDGGGALLLHDVFVGSGDGPLRRTQAHQLD